MRLSQRAALESRILHLDAKIKRNATTTKAQSMSDIQQRRIVLTGARRDFTGRLGDHHVQSGVILLQGVAKDLLAWEKHIAVMWQGFPQGDPRIEAHERAILAELGVFDGKSGVLAASAVPDRQTDVPSNSSHGQSGAIETATLGSPGDAASAGTANADATLGDRHAEVVTPPNVKLVAAIGKLDDANDAHWTALGLPKIEQVARFFGSTAVTRAMIEEASERRRKA